MPTDPTDVPKLPRGKGISLPFAQVIRIGMTVTFLVAVLALRKPCATAASQFVNSFGEGSAAQPPTRSPGPQGSAVAAPLVPGEDGLHYVRISADMTPEEVKVAIERAKAAAGERGKDGASGSNAGSATGRSVQSPSSSLDASPTR